MSEPSFEPVTPPSVEVRPAGAPTRRRWLPVVVGAVAFVLALGALALVAGDWLARNVEMRALVTAIEGSEKAMGGTQDALAAVFATQQGAPPPTAEETAALDAQLAAAAAKGEEAIGAAGDVVAGVRVLPWHEDILDGQAAYVAHNQSWQDYMAAASADPAELAKPQERVNESFAASEAPLRAAIPTPPLFQLTERIDVIFAPQPTNDNGPTQEVRWVRPAP